MQRAPVREIVRVCVLAVVLTGCDGLVSVTPHPQQHSATAESLTAMAAEGTYDAQLREGVAMLGSAEQLAASLDAEFWAALHAAGARLLLEQTGLLQQEIR